jgi:uncharacterized membrane protein
MAFCANCGASVSGRFCQQCGAAAAAGPAAPGPGATPPPPPPVNPPGPDPYQQPQYQQPQIAASVGMTDNMASALCYLFGFITGILFLVLAPYNQNRDIRFHAFQSIFLNIAWVALWIVISIVMIPFRLIPFLGTFMAIVLQTVIGLGGFVCWLYMMFKTYNGEKIVLPVIGPLAEKQAGV